MDLASNVHTLTKECNALLDESEQLNLSMTNLKHQHQVMSQAIESCKPPNGLTPYVKVNAPDKTEALEQEITEILQKAGLDICRALQTHYQVALENKHMQNGEISESLENKLSDLPPGPQSTELIKLVEDRALQIKSKIDKREAELALRMSGKWKRAEGDREAPTDASSSSKKLKPQPRGENNDELKECIRQVMREEVSNNQSNHTSYHDAPPPAVQDHTPPRERSRRQRSEAEAVAEEAGPHAEAASQRTISQKNETLSLS